MAINSQDLASSLRFALDAEGADHYDDNRDIIPAINLSVTWLVNVINRTLNQRKLGEEIFRDLTQSRVFAVDGSSRISIENLIFPNKLWTILAVYPLPDTEVGLNLPSPTGLGSKLSSSIISNRFHVRADKSAKRLTVEEWAFNRKNPFEAGSESGTSCNELNDYAYLYPVNHISIGGLSAAGQVAQLEIRPKLALNDYVTVIYVESPTKITTLGVDDIQFPESIFNLLFNKSLSYISYKQGDNTNIFSVSENDIQLLLNTIL